MNDLHTVGFIGEDVTDAMITPLKNLTGLQGLILRNTQLTDASFEDTIRHLKELREVKIQDLNLTDKGFAYFEAFGQIRRLDLTQVKITIDSLRYLREMRHLLVLDLAETGIPEEMLTELARELPDCVINGGPPA